MSRKRLFSPLLVVAVVLAMLSASALAQKGREPCRERPGYNPTAEITVQGTVTKIEEYEGCCNWKGIHLFIATEDESYEVRVGPAYFITAQDFELAEGAEIEVTGAQLTGEGIEAIIARLVKQGEATLTLRDDQGIPQWRGSGRRGRGPCCPGAARSDARRGGQRAQ